MQCAIMRRGVYIALLTVLSTLVVTAAENDECEAGKNWTAAAYPLFFNAEEVRGITIQLENGTLDYRICFFDSRTKRCQDAEEILKCNPAGESFVQHCPLKAMFVLNGTELLANVRMSPPNTTRDEAFVIRVRSGTLVYATKGGPCSTIDETHIHNDSRMLLLQRPGLSSNPSTENELQAGSISAVTLAVLLIISVLGTAVITYLVVRRSNVRRREQVENAEQPVIVVHPPPNEENHGKTSTLTSAGVSKASVDSGKGRSPAGSAQTSAVSLSPNPDCWSPHPRTN